MAIDSLAVRRGVWLIAGLLLALLLAGSQRVVAGERGLFAWQRYDHGLPSYALAVTVAVQPTDPAVLYVGTYEPPGLWRSGDRGRSWAADDAGLGGSPVFALYWDGRRSRWLAGTRAGLYAREVGLASLRPDQTAWQPAGLGERIVYAVVGDEKGRLYAATEDGLFRSSDGASWEAMPLAAGQMTTTVLALDVSPDGRMILVGTAGQGAWISSDGGATWAPASDPTIEAGKALAETYVSAVLLDTRPGGAAYLSTTERAYRSTDGGASWQLLLGLEGHVHAFVAGADGRIYAALAGQVARSADGGRGWAAFSAGLQPNERVLDLAVDPDDPNRLYAAAWDGIYFSSDGGQSWARSDDGPGHPDVNVLAWDAEGNLLAGTRSGLFRREPEVAVWEPVPDLQGRTISALARAADGRTLYAGCAGGLFRSADGGRTWSEMPSELGDARIAGLMVDPADPDHLLAWVAFGRVHESRDGGRSWVARWEGLGDVRPVTAIHRTDEGRVYVGAEDGLFRWEPARQSWEPLALPLAASAVFEVASDARMARAVYVGATDGLWRSMDSGHSWSRWGKGLEGATVTALAISPADGRLAFAGTRHMGLYVTTDGGATWRPARESRLASASVRDILFNPDGRTVYIASDQGVWRGVAGGE